MESIITKEMLEESLLDTNEQKSRKGQLEGAEIIHLNYLNISKITCLWLLKNLKYLNLSNNNIVFIENLSDLVNLQYLNLSFNKIEKIQNLNTLTKLTKLSLYANKITEIKNLDALKDLKILSIGKNGLSNWKFVPYLRNFKQLKCVNLLGNPCCVENRSYYIYAYIPQLIYYNYRKISLQEKYLAYKEYESTLIQLEKEENKYEVKKEEELTYNQDICQYGGFFIDIQNEREISLLISQSNDAFVQFLLNLDTNMKNIHINFHNEVNDSIEDLMKCSKELYVLRKNHVDHFHKYYDNIKLTNLENKRNLTQYVINLKSSISNNIYGITGNNFQDKERCAKIKLIQSSLEVECKNVRQLLLCKEGRCHKDSVKLIDKTNDKIGFNIANMLDNVKSIFKRIRTCESDYTKRISENIFHNIKSTFSDIDDVDGSFTGIMKEEQSVYETLHCLRCSRLKIIDNIEENIAYKSQTWKTLFCNRIKEMEALQNSEAIDEIYKFIELQLKQIDE